AAENRFCSQWGAALPDCALKPTTSEASPIPEPPLPARSDRQARFTPGELLGGRYRIVALLGKGVDHAARSRYAAELRPSFNAVRPSPEFVIRRGKTMYRD